MRAKRSKKYRKIMSTYGQAFSFREPYQVLLDSNFLRTCHAFHMPLQKYLENTLHGQCRPYITQCTLAKIANDFEKHKERTGDKRKGGRADFLPPPTEVPLRYCKHRNAEGQEVGVIEEGKCLLDLLSGQVKGNEVARNKQHYILASADAPENEMNRKGHVELRERARLIPGVPIIYVKRSVMILEELSASSEATRRGDERAKFKEGLVLPNARKRKRGETEDDEVEDEVLKQLLKEEEEEVQRPTARGLGRAKGPNPLSVRKKKVRVSGTQADDQGTREGKKKSSRRTRGKKKKGPEGDTQVHAETSE
ncbi:uncharacterized protein HMPREF1541_04186 [Cyphellophora europaea CBS 101466]|uniref:UTP23 sensor motif region domain-containing protein n=1 Tax=Cyphellophora europaea (strain CBS 101466) TaxID=1220924 RepID=W2S0Y0_CYPE1|nr:uncharacterized protein HMPREF1541_04186 [Cyphellophora europaea CBS 101466]ETN42245.1 hypothetical protein HMPREF1541_04186 [Cyphellophora europaea CBS 101466]